MLGNSRMGDNMVKELSLLGPVEESMKGNTRMEISGMDKEIQISLMDISILGNTRMGTYMVKEHTLTLMGESMLVNSSMGYIVKEHSLTLMVESMWGNTRCGGVQWVSCMVKELTIL